jgi:flagellar biosynthetic protein FliQ
MDADLALYLLGQTLKTAALVTAPVLLTTLVVGLLVSIFQVVTQIQEMTLTFVPKLVAVLVVFMVFGHWMLTVLMDYATHMFGTVHMLGAR